MKKIRFNSFHGENIILSEDNTIALRNKSYANGLVFSEKPLGQGELFLIEITKNESDWCGHIRLGLTQLNPNKAENSTRPLPAYSIPDLAYQCFSWIYPVSKFEQASTGSDILERSGIISKSTLEKCKGGLNLSPTDVGSRIGICYIPSSYDSEKAQLHFIINGVDQGPIITDIPCKNSDLFVVIDVYGTTKEVKIIQV